MIDDDIPFLFISFLSILFVLGLLGLATNACVDKYEQNKHRQQHNEQVYNELKIMQLEHQHESDKRLICALENRIINVPTNVCYN